MPKLKVLQICEATNAGVGRHTMDLCGGLVDADCDVHLLYSTGRIDDAFRHQLEHLPQLKTEVLEMRRKPHPHDGKAVSAVRRYIKRHGPFDILHGQSSKGGAIARMAGIVGRTPVVYTPNCISTMAPTFGRISRFSYRWIEWLLSFSTSMIICTSPDEFEHIHAMGVPKSKLRLIYYGIEPPPETDRAKVRAALGLSPEATIVGFVGRLSAQKNPELLIRAFAAATSDIPSARLAMIGVGEEEASLKSLARRLAVEDRIDWLGYRMGYHAMPAFDILAVPSRYDTGPIVMMESMALGVPIVITNVGCVRYVMTNGENGFVLPSEDLAAMTASLRKLIVSPELRARLAAAASEKAMEFKRDTMIAKTLSAYDDARNTGRQSVAASL